jgi:hypothetical protein
MILVASLSPGFTLLRLAAERGLFDRFSGQGLPGRLFVVYLAVGGCSTLLSLTFAVLILAARRPRSSLREVARGPGVVACLVALASSALPLASFAVGVLTRRFQGVDMAVAFISSVFGTLDSIAGPMIIGAWMALALLGAWKPGRTWTDRVGCAVGVCFVFIYIYTRIYFGVVEPLLSWWGL